MFIVNLPSNLWSTIRDLRGLINQNFLCHQSLMRALPAEEKAKIEQLTEGLKLEKTKLERELTKWDESGNDIIILAKKMCMMMMEMSDFTRLDLFFSH